MGTDAHLRFRGNVLNPHHGHRTTERRSRIMISTRSGRSVSTSMTPRWFEDIAIETFSMEHPVRSPMDARIGRAAIEAATGIYDDVSVAPMMIGTGPMYPIAATLGIPTVSPAGVCDPTANIHAPNESCLVGEFLRTATHTAAWLEVFAAS